jgi:hypothetical protein
VRTPSKALKYALLAFVAVSIGAAAYKIAGVGCCAEAEEPAAAAAAGEAPAPAVKVSLQGQTARANAPSETKTAVVYYFYTDTRCSSCQTIEAYTKEAVEAKLSAGYKGWQVEFRGVNIDEKANGHFVEDYWLNSKAVIVQKFSEDKALNWGKLDKVWTLVGDKDAFIAYVVSETHKLLDEK